MADRVEYLFCINTGRSGSDYLGRLLRHAVDCEAYHEPEPIGNGSAMRRYLRGDAGPMREITRRKAEAISRVKTPGAVYAETNHCFIKGFGWLLPAYLSESAMGVIVLKREPSKIAASLLRIGCSPLVSGGRDWVMTPGSPGAGEALVALPRRFGSWSVAYRAARLIKFPFRVVDFLSEKCVGKRTGYPGWLTRYELDCLEWYVDETNARAEAYRRAFPGVRVYEVSIEDLNDLDKVRAMLTYFGLEARDSLADAVGRPTNLKASQGSRREAED